MRKAAVWAAALLVFGLAGPSWSDTKDAGKGGKSASRALKAWEDPSLSFGDRLGAAAEERARHKVRYDGAYVKLKYPGGDVPASQGVCTDEVVRTYRLVGIDLQKLVHEDMTANFADYPDKFRRKKPDANIDHRLVYNLHHFFNRHAQILPGSQNPKDYQPGDMIVWDLDNFQLHVGMVTRKKSPDGKRYMIMHNIAAGPKIEDKLFDFRIVGHYRFDGRSQLTGASLLSLPAGN